MEKSIEELEKELQELEESNRALWDTYGSELCAGDMSAKEQAIRDEILRLKTIQKWKKLGLLDVNGAPFQIMQLADDLFESLRNGSKELTIRKGRRDVKLGELVFEGAKDKLLLERVTVTEVRYLKVVDVPEDALQADGFKDWTDFYEGMKKFYPDLDLTDECTIIFFDTSIVTTQ